VTELPYGLNSVSSPNNGTFVSTSADRNPRWQTSERHDEG